MEPSTETIGVVLETKHEQQLAIDALQRASSTMQQDMAATVVRERLEGLNTVMHYGGNILLTAHETTRVINDLRARGTAMPESRYSDKVLCPQSALLATSEWLFGAIGRYRLRRNARHMRNAYAASRTIVEARTQIHGPAQYW